ncbi:MAG: PASTA domain-containing protein [Prevotellaceae bacterium]|nr:PASTA domain-containing protein [Prevotellaceae bacterium]
MTENKKYPLWKNVIAMVIVLALFMSGAIWATDIYTRHGEEVTVPDLSRLTVSQAQKQLEAVGLEAMPRDTIYKPSMPEGVVCLQSVAPGTKVKQGRTIYLTLTTNKAETITMPDIADNSSYREATAKLIAMGFSLTPPQYIEGEKDWVYAVKCNGRNVFAGSRIDIDAPVTLVVGSGYYSFGEQDLMEDSVIFDNEILEIF